MSTEHADLRERMQGLPSSCRIRQHYAAHASLTTAVQAREVACTTTDRRDMPSCVHAVEFDGRRSAQQRGSRTKERSSGAHAPKSDQSPKTGRQSLRGARDSKLSSRLSTTALQHTLWTKSLKKSKIMRI